MASKNTDSVKVTVVGCGYWGIILVRNIAELGVLAAVCNESHELASQYAGKYSIHFMDAVSPGTIQTSELNGSYKASLCA